MFATRTSYLGAFDTGSLVTCAVLGKVRGVLTGDRIRVKLIVGGGFPVAGADADDGAARRTLGGS